MARLNIEIPDAIVDRVHISGDSIESVIVKALNQYLAHDTEDSPTLSNITQSRTWQLCGQLSVIDSDMSEPGQTTNYAEEAVDQSPTQQSSSSSQSSTRVARPV